ncbi:hypothetical protein [Magnetospirillum molischianum]|uniref:Transmembrane protein n=1 Tax=Magnetospirillum molischianum DSM 120 TaxID=1150626 RepID=H8FRF1_MAGML|nr:hypothetical protein [Magnetospirillum molischianum]CCG40939.1 conserved membrane hypothetical protein [Magnetospirillum molischianum DSM 120]
MTTTPSRSRSLSSLLTVPLAVLLMLFEEYLWGWLRSLMARLGRLASIARIEAMIVALPAKAAAFVFLLPFLLILPVKLVAVWAIATGHFLSGLVVLISAKLVATALFARLYTLCRPALMSFGWFVWVHDTVIRAKNWAHARLESWAAWRQARAFIATLRARWFPRRDEQA